MLRRDFLGMGLAMTAAGCTATKGQSSPARVEGRVGEEWAMAKGKTGTPTPRGLELLQEAKLQIANHRRVSSTILASQQGKVLPAGTQLDYSLQNHHFDWGFSHPYQPFEMQNPLDAERAEAYKGIFNTTTLKCYWAERWHQPIELEEGKRIYTQFDAEKAWAMAQGMRMKGHPLVWILGKAIPKWVQQKPLAAQQALLEGHIAAMLQHAGPEVQMWDFVNEALWEVPLSGLPTRNWPAITPPNQIAQYLLPLERIARQVRPNAILTINDYGYERTYRPEITALRQRERCIELIRHCQDLHVKIDAIGTQAHVGEPYSIEEFADSLAHLSTAGLPLQITEFWVQPEAWQSQDAMAEYLTNMLTLAFGSPAVQHLTYWGGPSNLFKANTAQPSAVLKVYKQLVAGQWHSKGTATVQADGTAKIDGYKGQYALSIADSPKGEGQAPATFQLVDSAPIHITL